MIPTVNSVPNRLMMPIWENHTSVKVRVFWGSTAYAKYGVGDPCQRVQDIVAIPIELGMVS